MTTVIKAGRRSVELSRPRKVLFPPEITKEDLARYYERIAPTMLPHLRGRAVSMERFPDGIEGQRLVHKNVPGHFPDWIDRVTVAKRGGKVTHVVCSEAATLVYLANQASITPHVWLSRTDRIDRPDRMIFDFDPSDGTSFATIRAAAQAAGDLMRELGLAPFAMTTGSRGIHVTVPLQRRADFDVVRDFARDIAEIMVAADDRLTLEHRKINRGDRIYVDVGRNAYAQTAVPPYAVRPRPKAPVATPLEWDELAADDLAPDGWTIETIFERLQEKGDPWAEIGRAARPLGEARKRLNRLLERQAA
jgi:bifunctional non-homologous end joining protein LigD